MSRHLLVRHATSDDIERLCAFYAAEQPGTHVLSKRPEAIAREIAGGYLVIGEQAGTIVTAAGATKYLGAQSIELGGCVVTAALRGYGLQKLLLRVRIATVVMYDGTAIRILSVIHPGNTASLKSATAVGFVPVPTPDEVLALCATCDERPVMGTESAERCCSTTLEVKLPDIRHAVRDLLNATRENGVTLEHGSGSTPALAVNLDVRILRGRDRDALQEFAFTH